LFILTFIQPRRSLMCRAAIILRHTQTQRNRLSQTARDLSNVFAQPLTPTNATSEKASPASSMSSQEGVGSSSQSMSPGNSGAALPGSQQTATVRSPSQAVTFSLGLNLADRSRDMLDQYQTMLSAVDNMNSANDLSDKLRTHGFPCAYFQTDFPFFSLKN